MGFDRSAQLIGSRTSYAITNGIKIAFSVRSQRSYARQKVTKMSILQLWGAALQLLILISSHLSADATQSCGSLSEAELIKRRIESVKLNLYAQLGITLEEQQSIPANATVAPPNNETLEEYSALINASMTIEKNREKKCLSEDFYAKPVTFFAGSMSLDGKPCNLCSC